LEPKSIILGIGCDDAQGRAITLEFDKFYLINTYVPNSGDGLQFKSRRLEWDKKMLAFIKNLQTKNKSIIWTGDLNVAIENYDVYDGETNKNREKTAGFTPYERSNFRDLLNTLQLVDSYRVLYPNVRREAFTFFSVRGGGKKNGNGWRLDYFIVSKPIVPLINDIQIRRDTECSDHVPLVLTMKNPDVHLK